MPEHAGLGPVTEVNMLVRLHVGMVTCWHGYLLVRFHEIVVSYI